MNIDKLGNGVGLLYATDITSTDYIISGITNNSAGVEQIKKHALTRSPVGYQVNGRGSVTFTSIGVDGNVLTLEINGVSQISGAVFVSTGNLSQARIDLAEAVNSYTPVSGVNYRAEISGSDVVLVPSSLVGNEVNGHVVSITTESVLIVATTENISGGTNGGELLSNTNGVRYYLNATENAVVGDILSQGTEEISRYIIKRGTESQTPSSIQEIANESISNLNRIGHVQVLDLGASGATDLNSISGDFAINDILIVKNSSAYTITINDLSINSGNLKMSPTTFASVDSNHIIWFLYVEDAVDGLIWQEIYRNPTTLDTGSVTSIEMSDDAIVSSKIADNAVTTDKIIDDAITNIKMADDSIGTSEIINDAVTTSKVINDAITTDKIIDNAVTTDKISDDSITEAKISNNAITTDKIDSELSKGFFVSPVSWESGKQGLIKVKIPMKMQVDEILVSVTKGISDTDDAQFIPKDDSGTQMTSGQIDLPPSTPLGNDASSTPTANNLFDAGETMGLETIKTTPGGEAIVTVCYTRIA